MPDRDPSQTLGFLVSDVARLLRKRFEQRARGLGLTRAQWQVLAYLSRNEGIQQGALAEMLEVEPITLGRILDRLESAAMVERRAHPTDRRIWLLHMKPEAHPILEEMRILGAETRADALAGIEEPDRARLADMLSAMRCNLTAASNGANDREAKRKNG